MGIGRIHCQNQISKLFEILRLCTRVEAIGKMFSQLRKRRKKGQIVKAAQ